MIYDKIIEKWKFPNADNFFNRYRNLYKRENIEREKRSELVPDPPFNKEKLEKFYENGILNAKNKRNKNKNFKSINNGINNNNNNNEFSRILLEKLYSSSDILYQFLLNLEKPCLINITEKTRYCTLTDRCEPDQFSNRIELFTPNERYNDPRDSCIYLFDFIVSKYGFLDKNQKLIENKMEQLKKLFKIINYVHGDFLYELKEYLKKIEKEIPAHANPDFIVHENSQKKFYKILIKLKKRCNKIEKLLKNNNSL